MAYIITEYPDHEKLANGEILVTNDAKGIWQIVPNIPRPYSLVYLPENNNVYAVRDFSEFDGKDIQVIRTME